MTTNVVGALVFMGLNIMLFWIIYGLMVKFFGQKTRNQQQRRVYVGSRGRPSEQVEPTIYVSPNNLPPPPKYEALAPPSYEEVMSVTYPAYQGTQPQPIVYPITHAIANTSQNTQPANTTTEARTEDPSPSTVITVTSDERRTSVTVATS